MQQDLLINEDISDTESPKDHLEEISDKGSTQILRSPEGISDGAEEERLEASLEVENRQVEVVMPTEEEEDCGEDEIIDMEMTDRSLELEKDVKTIGMGTLVSISERRRGTILVSGTICVTGEEKIEIRNEFGVSLWSKGILGEDFSQEVVKIKDMKIKDSGWLWFPAVCWRDERCQHYEIFLSTSES